MRRWRMGDGACAAIVRPGGRNMEHSLPQNNPQRPPLSKKELGWMTVFVILSSVVTVISLFVIVTWPLAIVMWIVCDNAARFTIAAT